MTLLFLALLLGVVTLLAACGAGLLESRIGSIVTAAVTLFIVIGGVPTAGFMLSTVAGLALSGWLSLAIGEFYYRLFRSDQRSAPIGGYRRMIGYRSDKLVVAVAW